MTYTVRVIGVKEFHEQEWLDEAKEITEYLELQDRTHVVYTKDGYVIPTPYGDLSIEEGDMIVKLDSGVYVPASLLGLVTSSEECEADEA